MRWYRESSFTCHLLKYSWSTYYVGGTVLDPRNVSRYETNKIPALLVLEERGLGAPYWVAGEDYNFNAVRTWFWAKSWTEVKSKSWEICEGRAFHAEGTVRAKALKQERDRCIGAKRRSQCDWSRASTGRSRRTWNQRGNRKEARSWGAREGFEPTDWHDMSHIHKG